MSRAPHDTITRALPGEDNAARRRALRRRIQRVAELIPAGYEVVITPDGGDLHTAGASAEDIDAALDVLIRELGR